MPADGFVTEDSGLVDPLLSSFASPFVQTNRILRLDLAAEAGFPADWLLAQRVRAQEALSQPYRLDVEALSADSHLPLESLLGVGAAVRLRTAEGGERVVSGVVTRAEHLGADGGAARYGLRIEPVLAVLDERLNSRVFQDQSVPQIVAAILREHLERNTAVTRHFDFEDHTGRAYPARSYCLQYRESDRAFITRLLAEEGIAYRWRFEAGVLPLHVLILFDDAYALEPSSPAVVRFHRADGTEEADTVTGWRCARSVQATASSVASFDYKRAATDVDTQPMRSEPGRGARALGATLEAYDPQSLYYAADPAQLARYAELRQQAKDLAAQRFDAVATTRALAPGEWFELCGHPLHDRDAREDRLFTVLSLEWRACNNLPEREGRQVTRGGAFLASEESDRAPAGTPFECRFSAVRRGVPIVPDCSRSAHAKPTAWGPQTATVVGPAGEEIHTDEYGRIKVQFHWQRPADHAQGGAAFDERSSTWLRVAYPSAGERWGSQFIPRVGQEVLVVFVEGDIDRPVVAGVLYNGRHRPPEFSSAGSLPANKALSGVRTREHRGGRHNQLRFDDSTNEISAQLLSGHAHTQLNQGWLGTPRRDGKSEPRGEGFELATDAAGAIRAAMGVLISAWGRMNASGRQLSREEMDALLAQGFEEFKALGDYAERHRGLPVDARPQHDLKQAFADWENGSNTTPGKPNGGQPVIGVTAPNGIGFVTPQAVVTYAGTNIDMTAREHLQLASGLRTVINAGQGISQFTQTGGIHHIANQGDLLQQAQHGDAILNARHNVRLTATEGEIVLMAPRFKVVTTDGSYLKLGDGGVEIGSPGPLIAKVAAFRMQAAAALGTDLPIFDSGGTGLKFKLVRPQDGQPLEGVPYRLTLKDGSKVGGRTDAQGNTSLAESERFHIAAVSFGDDLREAER